MRFLLDELIHFSLALAVGLFFSFKFGNPWFLPVALIFGFLIDVDHLFDYFSYYGAKFNLKNFLNVKTYMRGSGKVYVFLHGWEYVAVFWLIGRMIGIAGFEWTISLSYLAHLCWDNFSFKHHPLLYFLIYRMVNGFKLKAFQKT